MRGSKFLVSSLVLGASLWSAAIAAPATAPVAPAVPVVEQDCQKVGGDVSVLIDKQATSPNLPAARAAFQVGIMECMDGDDAAANKHYQDAKKLLSDDQKPATPASAQKPKQAG
ncbi:MAG TPA: hypothetical protein VNH44_18980 [Micropepsaceae bacterium]|nr:hypothetical protein [Micropepsaceae bacterium]